MRASGWSVLAWATLIAGCTAGAAAVTTVTRAPLGAHLTASAATGAPVPLRVDPTARVMLSTAGGLPPASFLPSQAARGARVYSETCAECHQAGAHVGQGFVDNWNDRRVYDFYALVRATMPLDNPGGLKDQDYLDVVAYLLRANHQAVMRQDSLSADSTALRSHKIAVRFP